MVRKYLKDTYLSGNHVNDNFIFYNVSDEIMDFAKNHLKSSPNSKDIRVISIGEKENKAIEKVLSKCENKFQQAVVADIFVATIVLNELINQGEFDYKTKNSHIENYKKNYEIVERGNFDAFIKNFSTMPTSRDVKNIIEKTSIYDINFFLQKVDSKFLQQGLNNFLDNNNEFIVKMFSDSANLASMKMTNSAELIHKKHYKVGPYLDSGIYLKGEDYLK